MNQASCCLEISFNRDVTGWGSKAFLGKTKNRRARVKGMFKWRLLVQIHYGGRLFISPDRRVKRRRFNARFKADSEFYQFPRIKGNHDAIYFSKANNVQGKQPWTDNDLHTSFNDAPKRIIRQINNHRGWYVQLISFHLLLKKLNKCRLQAEQNWKWHRKK